MNIPLLEITLTLTMATDLDGMPYTYTTQELPLLVPRNADLRHYHFMQAEDMMRLGPANLRRMANALLDEARNNHGFSRHCIGSATTGAATLNALARKAEHTYGPWPEIFPPEPTAEATFEWGGFTFPLVKDALRT